MKGIRRRSVVFTPCLVGKHEVCIENSDSEICYCKCHKAARIDGPRPKKKAKKETPPKPGYMTRHDRGVRA